MTRLLGIVFLLCLLVLACGGYAAPPPAASSADELFVQAQFEPARKAYAAAVLAAPTDPAAHVGLIRALLRLDRWDDALTEAQAFAAKMPENADAHGLLALALIRAGWQEPYADEAKKSLALDPQNYWGLVASGRAADWDGKEEDARAAFRKASGFRPDLPDAWLGLLQTLDDDKDAVEEAKVATQYLALNPQGQPHDREVEDVREVQANGGAFRRGFGNDPAFQQVEDKGHPDAVDAATLKVDFAGDYVIFPVTIDGQRFRLLFDTGAGDVTLTSGAARRLKLPVLAHSFMYGVSGRQRTDVLKAGTMTLGGLQYRSIRIRVMNFSPAASDGILGGAALNDCVITLDYGTGTATLNPAKTAQAPPPLPSDKTLVLPFRVYKDHLFVPVWVNGRSVWAMLDTGARFTPLSLRLAKEQLKDVPKDEYHAGSYRDRVGIGDTDRRVDYVYSRDQSTLTLSQEPPVSLQTDTIGETTLDRHVSPDYDFEIGLLLGASSLTYARRVTFDYPRRLLTFEYQDPDLLPKTKKK